MHRMKFKVMNLHLQFCCFYAFGLELGCCCCCLVLLINQVVELIDMSVV